MKFSVLLSVYKKEKPEYLDRALKSIYNEQSLKPNEIILVQDGELTDELYNIINIYKNRLNDIFKVIVIEKNQGLANALNVGLKECKYDLIARMDTDDISMPQRFEKQIEFMKKNPNCVAVGSYIGEFTDINEQVRKIVKFPINNKEALKFIKLRTPIAHPSVMFKKNIILQVGGYPKMSIGQDIALWSILLAEDYQIANIPEVLLKFRINTNFYNRRGWKAFIAYINVLKLQYKLGLINEWYFIRNLIFRFLLRMSPPVLKKIAYKILRK
jgi:glycosyltransferase involved in cell wall biosynthesis